MGEAVSGIFGGGGGGESSSSSDSAPWSGQIPYLLGGTIRNADGDEIGSATGVLPEASRLYDEGKLAGEYYNGSTVAPESGYTTTARDMIYNRATNGDANIDNAASSMANILNGNALSNNAGLNTLNQYSQAINPYSTDTYNQAVGATNAAINGNFSANGRYGSGAQANAIADADSKLATNIYSNAYNQAVSAAGNAANAYNSGINTQVSAASPAQALSNQAYTDANNLASAGASLDDYNQSVVDADVDRWNYNQQREMTALQNYKNLISGNYGGTTNSTTETSSGGKGGK